ASWARDPPDRRIVAAGITGDAPAVADLLAAIAGLPRGAVVLPGLDPLVEPESWAAIGNDPAHPQHLAALLLARLEAAPADIRPWPAAGTGGAPQRAALIAEAMRPAAETNRWREIAPLPPDCLAGLLRLDCAAPQEEAGAIALLMRERLERPGETAALVTPDRELARRVAAELARWGIAIDDSA